MHIAIVEPDEVMGHILAFVARRRGHKPFVARSIAELPERLPFSPAASIVALERLDEESLASVGPLRERYPEALILLTTEYAPDPLPLYALKAGFRDVIMKPLHPHEVILRAELQVEGAGNASAASDAIRVGDLEVDLGHYTALKNSQELELTKLELRLLFCLMEHEGRVSPTDRLLSFGWDSLDVPDASLLKTHISHLRKKLREAGGGAVEYPRAALTGLHAPRRRGRIGRPRRRGRRFRSRTAGARSGPSRNGLCAWAARRRPLSSRSTA